MEKIIIQDTPADVLRFLEQPYSISKNIDYYTHYQNMHYTTSDIILQENTIWYVRTRYVVKRNKKAYFRKQVSRQGFTYENRKVRLWFGASHLRDIELYAFFTHMPEFNWISKNICQLVNRAILESILNGTCTNPISICKRYLQYNKIKVPPKLWYQLMERCTMNYTVQWVLQVVHWLPYYTHTERILHLLLDTPDGILKHLGNLMQNDMLSQAKKLDKQINYFWSDKRKAKEHQDWTVELMRYEADFEDETFPLHVSIPQDSHFDRIGTRRELYYEGKLMHHCVYTNYLNACRTESIYIFNGHAHSERFTLALTYQHTVATGVRYFTFSQAHTYYNKPVCAENLTLCKDFVAQVNKVNDLIVSEHKTEDVFAYLPF